MLESLLPNSQVWVVFIGASVIGALLGASGSIALLRREALLGDGLAHCTLIGVVIAFLITGTKQFSVLFFGACISATVGLGLIKALRSIPVIKPDAALAVVLAGFFGLGLMGLRVVQTSVHGNKAGLESFIFGKASLMTASDVSAVIVVSAVVLLLFGLNRRSLATLCFDSQGLVAFRRAILSARILAAAILLISVSIALPATGIILTCSLLIVPPSIAGFFARSFPQYVTLSAVLGALCGGMGTGLSFYFEKLSTGASITLSATTILLLALMLRTIRSTAIFHRHRTLMEQ